MKGMQGLWLALLATALLCTQAFKEEEFKKCKDSAFCQRLRGNKGELYEVDSTSVKILGSDLTATVSAKGAEKALDLKLTQYQGFLRLHITEAEHARAEVPYVLLESLKDSLLPWQSPQVSKKNAILKLGDVEATLQYSPFTLEVKRQSDVLMVFNSRNMFNIEQTREKKEGDPEGWWQESFKTFTDSKPKGPQGISLDISFPQSDHVFGIPEHAKAHSLPPTVGEGIESEPYRLYNLDVFEYEQDSVFGLYGSIPFLTSHTSRSTTGVFWLNAAEMLIDVEKSNSGTNTQWVSESGVVDLFILPGPSPAQVLKQYSLATGTTQMPQYFALGYHQCRWNYKDEQDVHTVDTNFDKFDIPYDVIWLDIEHTDGKRYFTWDKMHFPTPIQMQERLDAHGRKLVTIIDPHIKKDDNYYVYKEAKDQGLFTKDKDGNDFDGWCWPGASSYVDMMNPDAVSWWGSQFALNKYEGSTPSLYVWNDMNEPSVFNGPEISMQKDNLHHGGIEHRDIHNVHGLLFHRATSLGLEERGKGLYKDGDRAFVLTRSFFAGSQRWGPLWTGDNVASWDALRVSVPMILALGTAGLPWAGADVGGFFHNPSIELYTRWNQLGAFYPFFRGHGHLDTARREPWVFGEPTTSLVREAIRTRYSLLPYLYSLFREAHEEGSSIWRPFWYEFPSQPELFAVDDSFMLGPSILMAPVLEEGATERNVTLPGGALWYDTATGALVRGSSSKSTQLTVPVTMDSIPSYIRGGSLIPSRERARRSSAATVHDPFVLTIALDEAGHASGSLYLDDGQSHAHTHGQFSKIDFSFDKGVLTGKVVASGYSHDLYIERIRILGLGKSGSRWRADSAASKQSLEASWGPLHLKEGLPNNALIVRKPDLSLTHDWTISFSPASA